jgi:hypothetical protein
LERGESKYNSLEALGKRIQNTILEDFKGITKKFFILDRAYNIQLIQWHQLFIYLGPVCSWKSTLSDQKKQECLNWKIY